jgi:hypothetical protein
MLNIQKRLNKYSLNPNNSVVVGSGILNALKLREINDIDILVEPETYNRLLKLPEFKIKNTSGLDMLTSDILEIGTTLNVGNHSYSFEELFKNSIVIDKVRYITLELLLDIKKQWLRNKDKKDIEIIEKYLKHHCTF